MFYKYCGYEQNLEKMSILVKFETFFFKAQKAIGNASKMLPPYMALREKFWFEKDVLKLVFAILLN